MGQTYDPKNVSVVVNGYTLTGYAEGTFVKISKNEDNFTPYVGAQGETSFAESADKSGTITVTLQSSSPAYLQMLKYAEKKSTYPVNVVDRNSGLTYGGTDCRIKKPADVEFSNEITEREFEIYVAELKEE